MNLLPIVATGELKEYGQWELLRDIKTKDWARAHVVQEGRGECESGSNETQAA